MKNYPISPRLKCAVNFKEFLQYPNDYNTLLIASDLNYTTEEWQSLIKTLSGDNNLDKIILSNILPEGDLPELLLEKISESNSLKSLMLNNLALDASNTEVFFNKLSSNTTLESLDLCFNNLDIEIFRKISFLFAFGSPSRLTKLILNESSIDTESIRALAKNICNNETLEYLYLERNKIEDKAVIVLGSCLAINNTLKELYLGSNKISDQGAIGLSIGLWNNSSLNLLSMYSNNIGVDGACTIAKFISENSETGLTELDLYNNHIGREGIETLSSAWQSSDSRSKDNLNLSAQKPIGFFNTEGIILFSDGYDEVDDSSDDYYEIENFVGRAGEINFTNSQEMEEFWFSTDSDYSY